MGFWPKFLLVVASCFVGVTQQPPSSAAGSIPGHPVKRILIGVDGLSHEAFAHARGDLGLFRMFESVRTHVAPFPSISDYSWNILTHARLVHGPKGRIRYYEGAHFDRERNREVSDPREYFRRLAAGQHYFSGAFEHYLNPFVESLLYLPTEELPRTELRQLKAAIFADPKPLVSVMVASSDALAHTRADAAGFLGELDQFLIEVDRHYRELGVATEIILVSDHGQASRPRVGKVPQKLKAFNVAPLLKAASLHRSESLEQDDDVVIPIMALANYGSAFFKTSKGRERLLSQLRKSRSVSLALHLEEDGSEQQRTLRIYDSSGSARLELKREKGKFFYRYRAQVGNPLHLPQLAQGIWLDDAHARAVSADTSYPDSLYRMAFSAFEDEAEFPDLLFTLNDDYYLQGHLDSFTNMYQTHGSLSARASLGVVASNWKERLPGTGLLRTGEVLPALGIRPHELFQVSPIGSFSQPNQSLALLTSPYYQGVASGAGELTNQRIFGLMAKALEHSRYVFDPTALKQVRKGFQAWPKLPSQQDQPDLAGLARLTDVLLKTGDLKALELDPLVRRYREKLQRAPAANVPTMHERVDGAKKAIMQAWSTPYLLERALDWPETEWLVDSRLPQWRKTWEQERQRSFKELPTARSTALAQRLFSEIFKERTLVEQVAPTQIPWLYNPGLKPMMGTTLVYVPGIYSDLFDGEIFREGLDALVHRFGLRVITAPVSSACSSSYNGGLIGEFLREDLQKQLALGRSAPRYFILGYSKGGMDALHAFVQDPNFVRERVQGLLTIASPLGGSAILDKTDLPMPLLEPLSSRPIPAVCQQSQKARDSITPAGAHGFMRRYASQLAPLTRYYSLSFVADAHASHLFMKATKIIAGFKGPNDGVVPLESTHFPEEFHALDLGVVQADHLAGIVASHFPQGAFMEALATTLLELRAFDGELLKDHLARVAQWNYAHPRRAPDLIDVPASTRQKFVMPQNQLGYHEDLRINLRQLGEFISGKKVIPLTPLSHPAGIEMVYDHGTTVDFRKEFQLSFESSAPEDADDNATSGWASSLAQGKVSARLASRQSSVRLSTYSLRFFAADFPELNLEAWAQDGVEGADVLLGGSGKDDSAFQLWFTFRLVHPGMDRAYLDPNEEMRTLGYYFGDEIPGKKLRVGEIYENYYSRKNLIVTTLPAAKQKLLGFGPGQLNQPFPPQHNLLADISAAYPDWDAGRVEIVGITLQHDSNDTAGDSTAYFKSLKLLPKRLPREAAGQSR